jgi:hypothetical protein
MTYQVWHLPTITRIDEIKAKDAQAALRKARAKWARLTDGRGKPSEVSVSASAWE